MPKPSKKEIVQQAVWRLKDAKFDEIVKSVQNQCNATDQEVWILLSKGVKEGEIRKSKAGRYKMKIPKDDCEVTEPQDNEGEPCQAPCPKKRKKKCKQPSPEPCCPPPGPEGCVMTFTRRCPCVERLLASESFEDPCILRNPAYLEHFVEEIKPEGKCVPAPECT